MAALIKPEAYLTIATAANEIFRKVEDSRNAKENGGPTDKEREGTSNLGSTTALNPSVDNLLAQQGLRLGKHGYVHWGTNSSHHPRNWSTIRKSYDLGMIMFLDFFMNAISAAGTPASTYSLKEFGVGKIVGVLGFTTMYFIGQALGYLLLSPYQESCGRKQLYIASALIYSVFCLPVAATPNFALVFIGRFVCGVASSAPSLLTRNSIEDLYDNESRTWGLTIWSLTSLFGLLFGPIFATQVAVALSWRWVFYLAAIIIASTGVLLSFIRESNASQLIASKVFHLQTLRPGVTLRISPVMSKGLPDSRTFIQKAFTRPVKLLLTEPIVLLTSSVFSTGFGLIYLLGVALPIVYADFGWSQQKAMLIFLFVLVGLFLSPLTRLYDRHLVHKSQRANRSLRPEQQLLGFTLAAFLLAVSLWWFAWTIPPRKTNVRWPASAISLIFLGYAVSEVATVLPRYVTNSYVSHGPSALLALVSLRAIFCATFPLFAVPMYKNLDNNIASSILAAIATASCLIPIIMLKFGRSLRSKSSYAKDSVLREDDSFGHSSDEIMSEKLTRKVPKRVRFGDEVPSETASTNTGAASTSSESGGMPSLELAGTASTVATDTTVSATASATDGDEGEKEGRAGKREPISHGSAVEVSEMDFERVNIVPYF